MQIFVIIGGFALFLKEMGFSVTKFSVKVKFIITGKEFGNCTIMYVINNCQRRGSKIFQIL